MSLNKSINDWRRWACAGAAVALAGGLLARPVGAARADKNVKPEDVVERTINFYGGRPALYAIQRNGILRGQLTLTTPEGAREGRTTTKFIRKEKMADDLVMLDLELPGTRFIIGFDGKQTWALHNGEAQEPSPETVKTFRASQAHSYEALLRYKENNAKLEYAGNKSFSPGNDLDLIDLTAADGTRTRYEISRKTSRVIYLEYEEKLADEAPPVKFRLYFKDFRVIQQTLVPFVTLVFQDGKQVEERKLVEVAYNVQLEEAAFKAENANKPAEAAAKP